MARLSKSPLLVLALLGAACDALPTEPVAPPRSTSVVSPSQSQGAVVEVDQTVVLFFHFDAREGLLSAHLPSDPTFCGGGSALNVADRAIVTTPSEILQRLVRIQDADSRVAVYRASSLSDLFSNFCGFLRGPARVAEGVVRHSQTFSNASFAAHWGGELTAVDGGSLRYSEVYQLTADAQDPANPATWSLNASSILLTPRP